MPLESFILPHRVAERKASLVVAAKGLAYDRGRFGRAAKAFEGVAERPRTAAAGDTGSTTGRGCQ